MLANNEKFLCLTLDLEKDYGHFDTYEAFANLDDFLALVEKYHIKLTVFVVGYLLEQRKDIIEKFRKAGVEFALHSYHHNLGKTDEDFKHQDIIKAKEVYLEYFGKAPLGYRAPRGAITKFELDILQEQGFQYDSSIFPYWRPGFYNNLQLPVVPFRWPNGLLEIPLSGLRFLRFPLSLSYMQFLGWNFYRFFLKLFGWPDLIVSGIHLHNLKKVRSLKGGPWFVRLFYLRNQDKGLQILEKFILRAKSKGFQPAFLSEIAQQYENLP